MKKLKNSIVEKYYTNVPVIWRKVGDGLLSVSTFITMSAISVDNDVLAYTALGIGIVGKFITNFFSENN